MEQRNKALVIVEILFSLACIGFGSYLVIEDHKTIWRIVGVVLVMFGIAGFKKVWTLLSDD